MLLAAEVPFLEQTQIDFQATHFIPNTPKMTYHAHNLTEVTGNLKMSLGVFVTIRDDDLGARLSYIPSQIGSRV